MLIPKRTRALHRFLEKALRERLSLRGIARIFGLSLETVLLVLGHRARSLPALKHSVAPARAGDVLELDEMHSFVHRKKQKRWLWIALCRRTRQVVAFAIGDRSERTCRRLFRRIPEGYRRSASYSDFWSVSAKVFQRRRHRSVGKETGETAQASSGGTTRCGNAWGAMSGGRPEFSKTDRYHHLATKYFIWHYNLDRSINTF